MNEWIIICTFLTGCFAFMGGYLLWKKGNLDSESTIQNQKKVNNLQEKLLDKSDKLSITQQNLIDQSEKLSKAQEELLKNSKGLNENQQKVIDLQTELTKKNQTIEDLQNATLNSLTGGSGIPVLSISTSNAYVSFAISNGTILFVIYQLLSKNL